MPQLKPQPLFFWRWNPPTSVVVLMGWPSSVDNDWRKILSMCLFVFRNRARTVFKILAYDGQGFWLCMKRFSQDKLQWWPRSEESVCPLTHRQLQLLLGNGNPDLVSLPADWKRVA